MAWPCIAGELSCWWVGFVNEEGEYLSKWVSWFGLMNSGSVMRGGCLMYRTMGVAGED